ncbi:phosphomannomutase [Candidatus Wolfebacteria bacterium CG_4_10_14_0_2_um_filter_39_18]|uniref:Phosphomannomutase n=1 Tax=Candidatus Wolfebacteria bacterium CG_4_10_14_0_2_um_filter_39_18 TaxID=1975061 RepID=A0A2M7TFI6_9BACT|nr:MAG: phosphomannomutase [Candidatus Wolfebacteria bacterium CG_4_10_14_0_2_um_filter_39_18]
MKINPYIFRGYDLRGEVDKDLTPGIVEHLGKIFGTMLKRRGIKNAVISRDSRTTSLEYSQAMIRGLNFAGIDTINIGMELIGAFYWSQYFLNCKGGVYVSASHNPVQYNGFKFAIDFSETLATEDMRALKEMAGKDDFKKAAIPGKNEEKNVREEYFNDLAKRIKFKKQFKIVIDPSNSTAGAIVPDLLRKFGCEIIEKNCNLDSSFPLGAPDPTDSKVAGRLSKEVLEEKADIGFSFDPDGDRLGIVDEKGNIIWNDILVAVFAMAILEKHPGAVIMYNILCSKAVEEIIIKYGGKPFMWRVGHSFLKNKNQEVKAAFIGELSGHFFFSADFYNHDDGIYSMLSLLDYISKTGKSLSEIISPIPRYISSPEIKVGCPDELKVGLMGKIGAKLRQDFPNVKIIDDERAGDGARFETDNSMFVVRYSQNGPYLTIKFEAKEQKEYDELKKYISELLHSYKEIDWGFGVNIESLD